MSYGTNASGQQGAELIYDVWNPALGTAVSAHSVLPNATSTDIFCSAQSLMLSGEVLTSGGDLTVNGARNSANNNTTIFSPSANTLTSNTAMTYARWYGTLVGLPNGQLAIFGGRQNVGSLSPIVPATTPELYDPALRTWTSLTGATSQAAFGVSWWYPRALVAPGGSIFVLGADGRMFYVSTANSGSIQQSKVTAPPGGVALPTVPFAPGKALSIRANQAVVVVDYTTSTPVVTPTNPIDAVRYWASGTVLADGRVLVTGGSAVDNQSTGVDYKAEIWDPNTGQWTAGASASKPRLYHSNAMLLPDATVLTGGGGAPGPVNNLNAEIYYPPYLYAPDGTPAVRPDLSATNLSSYDPGATLSASVGPTDVIARMTLVRAGSSTHSYNADQRFIELAFTQSGQVLTAQLPGDTTVLVPGYYMLFAINSAGVPSVAQMFPITSNGPPAPNFTLSPAKVLAGNVQIGTSSTGQVVTLTNSGGALALSNINFTGPGAGEFSQTNTCGSSVAGGSTCTLSVVFTPSAAGFNWAQLNVSGSGVTQTIIVNGTGSVPFTVSPATVSFGKIAEGISSTSQAITVTNAGSVPLPITSITLSGGATSQFSQTSNCPTTVAVGSACTINVVFTPSSTGYLWTKVNVVSPGATHSSTLSGTGS
jgi:galactose oxidase-like protein/HYDIN/CFA65/VesB family protein